MQWIFLGIAILMEVIATSTLKASNNFTRLVPSIIVICGYAIWAGLGIAFIITGVVVIRLFSNNTIFQYHREVICPTAK